MAFFLFTKFEEKSWVGSRDRHHVWRLLDPTLDFSSNFEKREKWEIPF